MYRETTGGAAVWVPVVIGGFVLLQSLFTDYEISLANLLPIKAHLAMDALAGLVLAASPWMFGFSEVVWVPHVAVGIIEVVFAITTHLHRADFARADDSPATRAVA
jgi:hypothetical protein